MTPHRFRDLLAAHGADLERWPPGERAAARELQAQQPAWLGPALLEAAALDQWLDQHVLPAPDRALLERVAAAAIPAAVVARPRSTWRGTGWLTPSWWPRFGLTLTGLAGALAGAFVVSVALRQAAPAGAVEWQARATAFGEIAADGSDE